MIANEQKWRTTAALQTLRSSDSAMFRDNLLCCRKVDKRRQQQPQKQKNVFPKVPTLTTARMILSNIRRQCSRSMYQNVRAQTACRNFLLLHNTSFAAVKVNVLCTC